MLPERRRNIIIFIVGIILFVLLVVSIFGISKYIKDRNEENNRDIDDRVSDVYPKDYVYYGITLDLEGIYRVYGITDQLVEKYIGVRSFYKVQDAIIKNNHLFLYTDGINDLRYEASNKEFYWYRYDDFYSNNLNIRLTSDYIIIVDQDGNVTKRKYGSSENEGIINKVDINNILIYNDILYYTDNKNIYSFDLNTNYKKRLDVEIDTEDVDNKIKLLGCNDTYFVYESNNKVYFYHFGYSSISTFESFNINPEIASFISLTDNGFYYQVLEENGTYNIKIYNLTDNSKDSILYTNFKVNKMQFLTQNYIYLELIDGENIEGVIYSIRANDIAKRLENKYLYLFNIGSNNEN